MQIQPEKQSTRKILCHLSFDDSESVFALLREMKAVSMFGCEYFSHLLSLHRELGASFTLYLLHKDALDGLEEEILRELAENSAWLKFSYHGNDGDIGSAGFMHNYTECTAKVASMVGEGSLSDILRVHRFTVDRDTADFLGSRGIRILLTADDDRSVPALDNDSLSVLAEKGEVVCGGMTYWKTDIRLEKDNWHERFEAWKSRGCGHIVVFSHEQLVSKDSVRCETIFRRMEAILKDLSIGSGISFL